jgi:signal transduction histidine kinase/DNA-directed RNA polymerase subunit N (RpoN/RPB10)
MKKLLLLFCFAFLLCQVWAQKKPAYRLNDLIVKIKSDSLVGITSVITSAYIQNHPDSGIYYAKQLITYGKQNNDQHIMDVGLNIYSYALYNKGNYPAALELAFQSLRIIENNKYTRPLAPIHNIIGNIYKGQQNYPKALYYYQLTKKIALASRDTLTLGAVYFNLAFVYKETNQLDSALYYSRLSVNDHNKFIRLFRGYVLGNYGDVYLKLKNYKKALEYYRLAYAFDKENADFKDASITCISLSKYYAFTGKPDSSIYYAQQALYSAKKASYKKSVFESADLLAHLYEAKHQPDSGFKYLKLSSVTKDSLYNAAKFGEMENLTTGEFLRQNEIQAAQKAYQNRLKLYALIFGLLVLLIAALLQWRNSRQRKKAYILLQKQKEEIEEQKAQAMIEVALERVRAKTMAMQKSDELLETSEVLFQQLRDLGETADQAGIAIVNEKEGVFELFATIYGNQMIQVFRPKIDDPFVMGKVYKAWKAKEKSFVIEIAGEELRSYNMMRNKLVGTYYSEDISAEDRWVVTAASFSKGILSFSSSKRPPKETSQLLERFAAVFDSTYTRFLDLQRAEAQAREANIEASLERVRSKTMAMHSSQDVADTVAVMFDELVNLGIEKTVRCGIGIIDDVAHIELWTAFTNPEGQVSLIIGSLDMTIHQLLQRLYNAWKNQEEYSAYEMAGDDLIAYYRAINDAPDYPTQFDMALLPAKQFHYDFFFPEGTIFAFSPTPLTPDAIQIFKRFAGVFGLTYRRYLDLIKAEAHSKEVWIELAMERIRARAMAMHSSGELIEVANILREQMGLLGQPELEVSAVHLYDDDSETFDSWYAVRSADDPDGKIRNGIFTVPKDCCALNREMITMYRSPVTDYTIVASAAKMQEWFKVLLKAAPELGENARLSNPGGPKTNYFHFSDFGGGSLVMASLKEPSKEVKALQRRAASVLDLAYQRFLDLKKAESQAREAQIEAALERVRSRTMAMQKSEELREVIQVVYDQLVQLGTQVDQAGFGMDYRESNDWNLWIADQGHEHPDLVHIPYFDTPQFNLFLEARDKGLDHFSDEMAFEEKNKFFEECFKHGRVSDEVKEFIYSRPGWFTTTVLLENVTLFITNLDGTPYSEAEIAAFMRFGKVFEQTYRRYLDLQKAEAQAREAQIEAALERVRSRTMAMQRSDELKEVIQLIYEQLKQLNFNIDSANFTMDYKETDDFNVWIATANQSYPTAVHLPYMDHPIFNRAIEAKKNNVNFIADQFTFEEKNEFFQYFFEQAPGISAERQEFIFAAPGYVRSVAQMNTVALGIYNYSVTPFTEEENASLRRFAAVFEQTYTRFNDLQQAEAQAHEAKIEVGLERVRAKAMSMQTSEELNELIGTVFGELTKLDVVLTRCLIMIFDPETKASRWWMANSEAPSEPMNYLVQYHEHNAYESYIKAWDARVLKWQYELKGKVKKTWDDFLFTETELSLLPEPVIIGMKAPEQVILSASFNNFGCLTLVSLEPLSDEHFDLLLRFAKVFDMSYTRFNDLKQAEAQAREARIEAALEKVRGKAMAMYNSKDLSLTASMVFTELRKLALNSKRCGVALLSKNSRTAQSYVATSSGDNDSLDLLGTIELAGHPSLEKQYRSWLKNENYFDVLKGDDLKSYKEVIYKEVVYSMLPVPDDQSDQEEYGYFLPFSEGFLFSWTAKPFSEKEIDILTRFKNIIDLTFRRYLELQKSEASAREAIWQASLDRVRAQIASMRSTGDLQSITPLVWNELTTLGVPFIRCGVFIVDEQQEVIHSYLSTPDGKAIAAFQLGFNSDEIAKTVLANWRARQFVTVHWNEEEFKKLSVELVSQGAVGSEEEYLTAHPPTSLDLHFFPFLQGMLYVGNITLLNDDEINLVQSLADAFSTAYARYEDFNKLEAAKKEVEQTLTGLKAAQTQLIQSEKMASLGELTAGIAHEIQNPLNFVNNFSEVNQEMIDELKEELKSGNLEEAIAIAESIRQNEEKINHHGKRADFIVKGMLQHSRTSTGEKQPTNINVLADEFIKLSYHGLRAKDKSFNAEMISDFDPNLPKVNVVQQDIGRVLLNLFNNAFYAVGQKLKSAGADYKPEVTVSTFTKNGHVTIKVKDNGVGIPNAIKEKIMQPFFTTKPTGEGTGLGLSLSYDMVVKGHGGTININSSEGEGSEFIVVLPV